MIKQYVPYKIAFALKELGFNEECFGWYYLNNPDYIEYERCKLKDCTDIHISAPLWQQVIDWFREKYKLSIYIIPNGVFDESKHVFRIDSKDRMLILDKLNNVYSFISDWIDNYEESRESSILKAIEIVKDKNSTKIKKD